MNTIQEILNHMNSEASIEAGNLKESKTSYRNFLILLMDDCLSMLDIIGEELETIKSEETKLEKEE